MGSILDEFVSPRADDSGPLQPRQLGALAPHDATDKRRQRRQVPGDSACGLPRIPLY